MVMVTNTCVWFRELVHSTLSTPFLLFSYNTGKEEGSGEGIDESHNEASGGNSDLLVNCINDMCDGEDAKDYHVEYYEDTEQP